MAGWRESRLAVIIVLISLALISISFNFIFSKGTVPAAKVQYELFGAEHSYNSMITWPKTVRASVIPKIYEKEQYFTDFDLLYLRQCWSDSDWLRMYEDTYCHFLWLRALQQGQTIGIDNILSVITQEERKLGEDSKSNQNGGMKCLMDGYLNELNIQGYWKPCTTDYLPFNRESFKSEIIAYHIDRILGFYRTPPVIPVYFETPTLYKLAREAEHREENPDPQALYKVQTVLDKCGSPNGAEGAMVGWSNVPIRVLDRSTKTLRTLRILNMLDMDPEDVESLRTSNFNFTRDSPAHIISWALENVALNMFTILMGNPAKFSHSVFALQKETNLGVQIGPLIYVDNDRSSWDNDIIRRGMVGFDHPLSKFCKFPMEIATRILSVNETAGFTVSSLVKESVSVYKSTMKENSLFTNVNGKWLDQRVAFLRTIIQQCIEKHGPEDVLFPEPWVKDYTKNLWLKELPNQWVRSFYSKLFVSDQFLTDLGFGEVSPFQNFHTLQRTSTSSWRMRRFNDDM